ncbi:hypothetical protein DUNSADRAFT_14056 [Dunaliella salina]|uniref:Encoded protein n=1 Tax=Dunaliella salina TaxID=3046 RepID=A0ABQ7G837_DUNSA|nr:hypothetical protein DUNSADRAFT_14056 [Dunaliella salina]|eukprot:KAF5830773.1 hypothetical protein DUNSADRAFT_14056 [Dunaliella salina]
MHIKTVKNKHEYTYSNTKVHRQPWKKLMPCHAPFPRHTFCIPSELPQLLAQKHPLPRISPKSIVQDNSNMDQCCSRFPSRSILAQFFPP